MRAKLLDRDRALARVEELAGGALLVLAVRLGEQAQPAVGVVDAVERVGAGARGPVEVVEELHEEHVEGRRVRGDGLVGRATLLGDVLLDGRREARAVAAGGQGVARAVAGPVARAVLDVYAGQRRVVARPIVCASASVSAVVANAGSPVSVAVKAVQESVGRVLTTAGEGQ